MFQGICMILLTVCLVVSPVFGAANAGAFIEKPLGPKATAMGTAFTSVADNPDAIFANPAGLGLMEETQIMGMTYQAFETHYYSFAMVLPTSLLTLGFGYIGASIEGALETSFIGDRYVETGNSFGYRGQGLFVSTGYRLNESVSLGSSFKYIQESLKDKKADGFGLDVGVLIGLGRMIPFMDRSTVGFSIKNVISPELRWNTDSGTSATMPLTYASGISVSMLNNQVQIGTEVQKKENRDLTLHAGIEYRLSEILPVRVGISDGQLSAGLGLVMDTFEINYSVTLPKNDEVDIFQNTSRISFGMKL